MEKSTPSAQMMGGALFLEVWEVGESEPGQVVEGESNSGRVRSRGNPSRGGRNLRVSCLLINFKSGGKNSKSLKEGSAPPVGLGVTNPPVRSKSKAKGDAEGGTTQDSRDETCRGVSPIQKD